MNWETSNKIKIKINDDWYNAIESYKTNYLLLPITEPISDGQPYVIQIESTSGDISTYATIGYNYTFSTIFNEIANMYGATQYDGGASWNGLKILENVVETILTNSNDEDIPDGYPLVEFRVQQKIECGDNNEEDWLMNFGWTLQ